MDLFDVTKACVRRWYVFLPIVFLAVLCSSSLYVFAKPAYSSQAMIGLALPPTQPQSADPLPRNGLMDAGGVLEITTVIADSLGDRSVKDQVVAAGGNDNYTAKLFPIGANNNQLPLIVVEASEPNADSASKTVQLVAQQAWSVTRRMQQAAGVGEDQMVRPVVVSPPTTPSPKAEGQLKLAIAIFLIGVAAAVAASVVVDVLLVRRNAREDSRRTASIRAQEGADIGGGSTTGGDARHASSRDVHVAGETTVVSR